MSRIYCAGPLFNPAERREMDDIAEVLEAAGYTTFVPHRDGLEFARLLPELQHIVPSVPAADAVLRRAIFSLDVFQLLSRSDAVVANINGRVPDEGTVVEAALAWFSGKAVVLYKNDSRSVLSGSDNPMLAALGNFQVVTDISELPQAVGREIHVNHDDRVQNIIDVGRRIADARDLSRESVTRTLVDLVSDSPTEGRRAKC